MTDLKQTALDFCRECLGWADVPAYDITDGVAFRFNDLNAVMESVRGWRDGMQDALDEYVTVTLSCASGEYIGHAFVGGGQPSTAKFENPCHALMAVCVEAARKLKAAG